MYLLRRGHEVDGGVVAVVLLRQAEGELVVDEEGVCEGQSDEFDRQAEEQKPGGCPPFSPNTSSFLSSFPKMRRHKSKEREPENGCRERRNPGISHRSCR